MTFILLHYDYSTWYSYFVQEEIAELEKHKLALQETLASMKQQQHEIGNRFACIPPFFNSLSRHCSSTVILSKNRQQ